MEKRFDIINLERIEIDLTLYKFFNENYTPIDNISSGYHRLYYVYVVFDEIECNGIDWFLNSKIDKDEFYSSIDFFGSDFQNEIYNLINTDLFQENNKISKEDILENLVIFMDKVQDQAVSWIKNNQQVLDSIIDELNKIYLEFTLPIMEKRSR
ncbi:hypothetical protein [Aquimarina sp. 2201CG14-23]|uniref:hypothetical protein n=1 Tax=Aquimarina mycalae TaxID=3040073 RepID=UPI002477D053|nr:hypothetical protein [Aquimarina sp. 2201CG14-23]MDH7444127.1 hypothetical protein [Aquimarina sp. 2201CG14-23]